LLSKELSLYLLQFYRRQPSFFKKGAFRNKVNSRIELEQELN